jgi:DNA-binding NtrC family response regulator
VATVLIIDDNEAVRRALELLYSLHDIDTVSAGAPAEGLALLDAHEIDLVVQDMNFTRDTTSGEEGIALFRALRERDPDLPIILLTAWTNLETAVRLVKAGAADYLGKPWDDGKLITTSKNLIELRASLRANRQMSASRRAARERLASKYDLCGVVYESDAMHELLTVATRVAHADVPVLITGPNGVGKEKLAEIVQANSAVRTGPFIKVNVGALPAELLESELFGTEAGAFTGATHARAGRFEAADGGTLFLDEIGNLPLNGQAKLLRVLQTGEFERLGSTKSRRVRVRIISATNTDLPAAIRAGTFREDLYYRLNVIQLEVPPLAARPDDILPLAQHFLGAEHVLADDARAALVAHAWPGNVRELRNCIQRAVLLSGERVIRREHLGLPAAAAAPRHEALHEPDAAEIRAALTAHGGVVAHAARALGMSRQALYRRMEKLGVK